MKSHVELAQYPFGIDHRRVWALSEPHTHLDVEFILMERGRSDHVYRSESFAVGPGQLILYWAGLPHGCVRSDADTMGYVVHLLLAWLLQWSVSNAFVQRLLWGEVFHLKRAACRWLLHRCRQWMRDRSAFDAAAAGDVALLELQAAVRRLAAMVPDTPSNEAATDGRRRREPMIRVGRMVHYMIRHYRQPLTAAQIAAAAGVHPNHAMRLFSRQMGLKTWDYVAKLRLAHAEYLLRSTDLPITVVALDAGFTSIGRFYLLFRAQFGTTPRHFRDARQDVI